MLISDYSDELFLFIDNKLSEYCKRKWIYKENTLVIDFEYQSLSFAYDIYFESGLFQLDIVNRKSDQKSSVKLLSEKKTKLLQANTFKEVLDKIVETFTSILEDYESRYTYQISMIVPVYNREKLIEKCIYTINEQTLENKYFEVIFVDDFSSDNSVDVIKKLIGNHVNYRILQRPINSGSASAPRNDGLMAAKGKYIYFVDSDDYIYPYTLKDMLVQAQQNNSDVVYVKYDGDPGRPWGKRPFVKGDVSKADIATNHLVRSLMSSKLIRSDILKDNKIYYPLDIKVGEDRVFMMEVLSHASRYSILGNKPYYYIVNHDEGRLTHVGIDLVADFKINNRVIDNIFIASMSESKRSAILSSWINVLVESYLVLRLLHKKVTLEAKKKYFSRLYFKYKQHEKVIDQKYIYKEFREIFGKFLQNDFDSCVKLSQEYKSQKK